MACVCFGVNKSNTRVMTVHPILAHDKYYVTHHDSPTTLLLCVLTCTTPNYLAQSRRADAQAQTC